MESYSNAFLLPLRRTLINVVSFVPRFLVAVILFAMFYGIAVGARAIARNALARVPHMP